MLSIDDIFMNWKSGLDVDRFTYENRSESIDSLVQSLYDHGTPMDDALFLRNRVIATLVTKEGMKNTGKYKGWKDNVSSDFEECVSRVYVTELLDKFLDIKNMTIDSSIPLNKKILDFIYEKYGIVTERMIVEAHTIGTEINAFFFSNHSKQTEEK